MNNHRSRGAQQAIAVLIAVAIAVALALVWMNKGASIAAAANDCRSVHVLAKAAQQRGDAHVAYYREEEERACEGKAPAAIPPTTSPSPSSPSTSVPSKPTSKTSSGKPPAAKPKASPGYVFYAWYSGKAAINDFGPKVAMDPSLHGMPMQDMSTKQALQELKYRYHRDPMLSASTGCAFKLWSCSPSMLQSKTQAFMKDKSAWNTAKKAIDHKVDGQKSSVKTLSTGSYISTYALNGGSYPEVFSDVVYRTSNMEALVFHDGTTLRLICGFQIYWNLPKAPAPKVRPTPMPKPSPGMCRTQEGVPCVLVQVCVPGKGYVKLPPGQAKHFPKVCPSRTTTPGTPTSTSTTSPPTSTTSTPPPSSTTPPTTPSSPSTLPGKCKVNKLPKSCITLPPGPGGSPTDNPPSSQPVPTHTGPTQQPTSTEPPTPGPTYTRPTPPNEGPTDTATGGPTGCKACG